jgi:hypothetical protein
MGENDWIGIDGGGYGHIDVVSTGDILTLKNSIFNRLPIRLEVQFGMEIETIFVQPIRITEKYDGGFNVLVSIIGGDNLIGELVLSIKHVDAFICVGQQLSNGKGWYLNHK